MFTINPSSGSDNALPQHASIALGEWSAQGYEAKKAAIRSKTQHNKAFDGASGSSQEPLATRETTAIACGGQKPLDWKQRKVLLIMLLCICTGAGLAIPATRVILLTMGVRLLKLLPERLIGAYADHLAAPVVAKTFSLSA